MKSPAMAEALKPLNRLDAADRARKTRKRKKPSAISIEAFKLPKDEAARKIKEALKNGDKDAASFWLWMSRKKPKARRYIVNDATYEALGVVIADNPNGTFGLS